MVLPKILVLTLIARCLADRRLLQKAEEKAMLRANQQREVERPVQPQFRVSLFAASTLNANAHSRVTLSQ